MANTSNAFQSERCVGQPLARWLCARTVRVPRRRLCHRLSTWCSAGPAAGLQQSGARRTASLRSGRPSTVPAGLGLSRPAGARLAAAWQVTVPPSPAAARNVRRISNPPRAPSPRRSYAQEAARASQEPGAQSSAAPPGGRQGPRPSPALASPGARRHRRPRSIALTGAAVASAMTLRGPVWSRESPPPPPPHAGRAALCSPRAASRGLARAARTDSPASGSAGPRRS